MRYEYRAKLIRVVDGDTIDFEIDLGLNTLVRIRTRVFGVDTPETYGEKHDSDEYRKGVVAKAATLSYINESKDDDGYVLVKTFKDKTGKYGRWLADVRPLRKPGSLTEHLLKGGYAKAVNYG